MPVLRLIVHGSNMELKKINTQMQWRSNTDVMKTRVNEHDSTNQNQGPEQSVL